MSEIPHSGRGPDDIRRLKSRLKAVYGDRFAGLRLYGSYARGDARADSDVDLLVLLHGEVHRWSEIKRLVDLSYNLELETGRVFELLPRSVVEYEAAASPFLRAVREEGLPT